LVEQGTFNPKVAGSIPARPITEITCNCLVPSFGGPEKRPNMAQVATKVATAR
jgi:hypothetical protein